MPVTIWKTRSARVLLALGLVLALPACDELTGPGTPPQKPTASPDQSATAQTPVPRSARSEELSRYYRAVQNNLLTRGLLRIDGGGPDTPFSADDLAANFETIAFFDEYSSASAVGVRSDGASGRLSRWGGPVRVQTEFGASVPLEQRAKDATLIRNYARRLAQVTNHSVTEVTRNGNFHVFVAGEDDTAFLEQRLKLLVPRINPQELRIFLNLPRSIYCLVVAFSAPGAPQNYTKAVALIRAEHPDLVRLACIHEEIAQGLGLANDSPEARPSIFNDDDEFALLTNHDELLLQMLYDPRLRPGMTADQARPVARIIARDLMGTAL